MPPVSRGPGVRSGLFYPLFLGFAGPGQPCPPGMCTVQPSCGGALCRALLVAAGPSWLQRGESEDNGWVEGRVFEWA